MATVTFLRAQHLAQTSVAVALEENGAEAKA
jgi:hypothetical protein